MSDLQESLPGYDDWRKHWLTAVIWEAREYLRKHPDTPTGEAIYIAKQVNRKLKSLIA